MRFFSDMRLAFEKIDDRHKIRLKTVITIVRTYVGGAVLSIFWTTSTWISVFRTLPYIYADLDVSTGHRRMSGKKSRHVWQVFSQRKQLFGVYFFISYHCLKTQKHSISMGLSCSGFSFYRDFNRQITYAVFYIQNRKTRLSKRFIPILLFFCPAWDSFSSILWIARFDSMFPFSNP